MTAEEHVAALGESIKAQCEEIAGGGLIGPSTAYFETAPDAEGNTLRFTYVTQVSAKLKVSDYNWDMGRDRPITDFVQPVADVDQAANHFIAGFKEIASTNRKAGEGVVWRITPRLIREDSGLFYFRARYAFVPPCSIQYIDRDGNPDHIERFEGGLP